MTRTDLESRLQQGDTPLTSLTVVCLCHNGNDSQKASQYIQRVMGGRFEKVVDIVGGLDAWSKNVDPLFPRY